MTNTQAELLASESRIILKSIVHLSGKILYSAASTLQPGALYILGFNPGGDPTRVEHKTISEELDLLSSKLDNEYLDAIWQGSKEPGGKPLQRRIRWLLQALGHLPETVCASNLIFIRSRKRSEVKYLEMADLCWPVHERTLEIVKPRLILVFDGLAYDYVGRRLAKDQFCTIETISSGHGSWLCRRAKLPEGHLVQVPHLSRYAVDQKTAVGQWIRALL